LKRRTVTFTPQARSDLLRIGDWIAERAGVDDDEVTIVRLYYGGQNWQR